MKISMHFIDSSQPRVFEEIESTYYDEYFYCLEDELSDKTYKFPLRTIHWIIENDD
jgi:hypothetical protein